MVLISLLAALALVGAACDNGEETPGTTLASTATTAAAAPAGSDAPGGADAASPTGDDADSGPEDAADDAADGDEAATTTTDPDVVAGLPSYEVVERVEADRGEEIVVVVEPGTYTNVELQNLVFDIVDRFAPLTAVVVDDPAAAELVFAEDRSPEDEAFLEEHMFLELVDGVEVTFRGPYSDLKGLVVGS
jgi:hypothetical protein